MLGTVLAREWCSCWAGVLLWTETTKEVSFFSYTCHLWDQARDEKKLAYCLSWRWTVTPEMFLLLLLSNIFKIVEDGGPHKLIGIHSFWWHMRNSLLKHSPLLKEVFSYLVELYSRRNRGTSLWEHVCLVVELFFTAVNWESYYIKYIWRASETHFVLKMIFYWRSV